MRGMVAVGSALQSARDRPPERWLAALAPAGALAWVAGAPGAAAGLVVAAVGQWSAPVAAALAHVWLVALLPADPLPSTLVAVEAAVLVLLGVPEEGGVARTGAATTAGAVLLAAVAWLALRRSGSLAVVGGTLVVAGAIAAGALDRIARARLAAGGGRP